MVENHRFKGPVAQSTRNFFINIPYSINIPSCLLANNMELRIAPGLTLTSPQGFSRLLPWTPGPLSQGTRILAAHVSGLVLEPLHQKIISIYFYKVG
jgi:hypothetical protein